MHKNNFSAIAVGFVLPILALLVVYFVVVGLEKNRLLNYCSEILSAESPDNYFIGEITVVDSHTRYSVVKIDKYEGIYFECPRVRRVTIFGKVFSKEISVTKQDYNKSYIVGDYTAKKFKEVKKGWLDSIKEDNSFLKEISLFFL